ncbi:hypothetical protein [Treponema bryantii]|uniref:hypothetical protein n=1 Tax=Treponema bryantii TaxID=163 RepID=UPI002B321269|nr:hypothetical protein TRBR_26890 [Treponema bryantii]
MTNLAIKCEELEVPEWDYFVSEIQTIYRLTDEETDKFSNSTTAKIIAAIPFVAGCYRPEVTAIAHLSLYMNEIKGFQKYYACNPLDDCDLFERLEPISHFRGGDKKIIECGMNTLAYIMIEGYHKSEKFDAAHGNYNPFVSGNWNYKSLKNMLSKKVFVDFNPFIIILPSIGGGYW